MSIKERPASRRAKRCFIKGLQPRWVSRFHVSTLMLTDECTLRHDEVVRESLVAWVRKYSVDRRVARRRPHAHMGRLILHRCHRNRVAGPVFHQGKKFLKVVRHRSRIVVRGAKGNTQAVRIAPQTLRQPRQCRACDRFTRPEFGLRTSPRRRGIRRSCLAAFALWAACGWLSALRSDFPRRGVFFSQFFTAVPPRLIAVSASRPVLPRSPRWSAGCPGTRPAGSR